MYEHVIRAVFGAPWAILPETLETIAALVNQRAAGIRFTDDEIRANLQAAAVSAGPRAGGRVAGPVGVIPIYGTIMQRASMMSEMSGGTSVQGITAAFRRAVADPEIGSILLDVDSPGGEVGGIDELAAEIRNSPKPVAAIANSLMASAAYWLASAAHEVIAAPSAMVGSIGVYTVHQDMSGALEKAGIGITFIAAGKYKVEDAGTAPLSEEAHAHIQQLVDDYYGLFVNAVATGRGVSASAIRSGYGEGLVLTAKRAVAVGLADRVGTFDEAVRRLSAGKVVPRGTSALVVDDVIAADMAAVAEQMAAVAEHAESEAAAQTQIALALARARSR